VRPGDLVVWRLRGGSHHPLGAQKKIYAIVIEMPMSTIHYKGDVAKIMTYNGKMYTVPLDSHYFLQVINEGG
jgi:hypothetical protein